MSEYDSFDLFKFINVNTGVLNHLIINVIKRAYLSRILRVSRPYT